MRKELTRGMHYSNRCPWNQHTYDPSADRYYYVGYPLDLTGFLHDKGDPWVEQDPPIWIEFYCAAYAAVLQVAMESQGVSATCDRIERLVSSNPDVGGSYTYWPICPAGSDSTDSGNYGSGEFSYHAVVRSNSLRYDSAASYYYKYDSSTWMNPVWEWPLQEHWQNLVSGKYWGHAYDDTTVAQWPFASGSQVPLLTSDDWGPEELQ